MAAREVASMEIRSSMPLLNGESINCMLSEVMELIGESLFFPKKLRKESYKLLSLESRKLSITIFLSSINPLVSKLLLLKVFTPFDQLMSRVQELTMVLA